MENMWICECGRENSGDVCTKCGAPHQKLSQTEVVEKIRGKSMRLLSSGLVLALTIFFIFGAVIYCFSALGMGGLTGFYAVGGSRAYVVFVSAIGFCECVFFAIVLVLCVCDLFKARRSAKNGNSAKAITALEKIRGLLVSYRVFYIISVLFNIVSIVFTFFESHTGYAESATDTFIFVVMAATLLITVGVGFVLQLLYNFSLTKLVEKIKARITDPLSKNNGKCTAAAVYNFIYFGMEVILAPFLVLIGVLFAIAVMEMASSGAMGTVEVPIIAAYIVPVAYAVVMIVLAGLMLAVSVPYLLLGIVAVKHNKLEKYAASLISENDSLVTAPSEPALPPNE